MQLLLVIIEKSDDQYSAYVPGLVGATATGSTREDVERNIGEVIRKRFAELDAQGQQGSKTVLIDKPRILAVRCSWRDDGRRCNKTTVTTKDGMCFQHWRVAYGHSPFNRDPQSPCLLCGERNQEILAQWDVACPVKAENPNWPILLDQERTRVREARAAAFRRGRR